VRTYLHLYPSLLASQVTRCTSAKSLHQVPALTSLHQLATSTIRMARFTPFAHIQRPVHTGSLRLMSTILAPMIHRVLGLKRFIAPQHISLHGRVLHRGVYRHAWPRRQLMELADSMTVTEAIAPPPTNEVHAVVLHG